MGFDGESKKGEESIMLKRQCPKCGSFKVIVKAKVLRKKKPKTTKVTYDFLAGPSEDKTIEILEILKCASCKEPYNEDKWKIPNQ